MDKQIDKYFAGELSDIEKKELFDLIESDEANKKEFIRMQNIVVLSKLFRKKGDKELADDMFAQLDASISRKRVQHLLLNTLKYAAVAIIILLNGWLISGKFFPEEKEILYTKIEVPKGQRVFMTFADGTEAWLSPRSIIRIPNEFKDNERLVELDGEGFFSVTKDTQRPFIVKTKQYNIRVLGTKFNVFAYSESNKFETDLVEGSVEVSSSLNPAEQIVLKPNEKAFILNNKLVKSAFLFNNEAYLKDGVFSFDNKQFSEIIDYLSVWYNIKFELRPSAGADRYVTGKFRQSDEIERILKALQGVHPFKYRIITNEKIEIY